MKKMVKITFRPQAWINDYAVDVDARGKTTFEVPVEALRGVKPHSCASDNLREHENCPEWAKKWDGPFECEWDTLDPDLER